MIGNSVVNHLMYADDLAVLSPISASLQQLRNTFSEYWMKYNDAI